MKRCTCFFSKTIRGCFLIGLVLLLTVSRSFAQNSSTGYYYSKNGLVEVPINQGSVLVYFKTSQITVSAIHSQFECLRTITLNEDKSDSLYAVEVVVNGKYPSEVAALKNRTDVFDVEPVLGTTNRYPVSNMFYVKLYQESDTSVLENVANYYRASVNRRVPYCGLWYELSVNKNSYANALAASVEFGETELFAAVDPGVVYEVQLYDTPCATDSLFDDQWGLDAINACDAWEITTGDTNIHVAVIDQGVDLSHREFSNLNVTASYDTYNGSNIYGTHGTLVSGVIFSNHDNNNIAGVAPDASLIKICDTIIGLFEDMMPRMTIAFNYAVAHGADVINNSWGGPCSYDHWTFPRWFMDDAIENALNNGRNGKGCVVVFASGNYNPYLSGFSSVTYPANAMDGILAVGSMNSNYHRSDFSCYGAELDVVAPGEGIYTTTLNNQYEDAANGTSFAAPHVSGVAALMLSVNPNMTSKQVSRIIEGTATKLTGYSTVYNNTHKSGGWNTQVGYGLLNAATAVQSAQNLTLKDLYVKDNQNDDGTEYNNTSTAINSSPDIKVYSLSTGIEVTDLVYGSLYEIRLTLRNDRSTSATISPSKIKVYWTVETGNIMWRNTWDNAGLSFCGLPICGYVSPTQQTDIVVPGNGYTVVTIPFTAPVFSTATCSLDPQPQSIALVALVDDGNLIVGENDDTMPIDMFVRANNNVAWHDYTMSDGFVFPFDPSLPKRGLFGVSPNPSDGRITVTVSSGIQGEQFALVVVNSFGNIVRKEVLGDRTQVVNMEGLPTGSYSVYLLSSGIPIDVTTLIIN